MEKQEQAPHLDEEQRKLLLSLLNSGPEAAAKTLKSKLTASPGSATGLLDAFVQFLFSASDSIKTETALVYCLWLACGGTNPNAVIQKIKSNSAGKSNACGRVWKSGDLAYNCADCQFDDTCAICVDCFRAGNHEGHDFSLIHVGGGCCDCGDPQAWKPQGFCKHHKGASEDDDPTETLPTLVKMASHVTFRSVLKHWLAILDRLSQLELNSEEREAKDVQTEEDSKREEEESQEEREKSTKASLILNWLAKMIEHFGDGIRRVMCVEIDGLTHSTTTLKRLAERKRKWAKPDATREGEQLQQEVEPIDVDISEDVKMTTLLLETDFILPSEISKGMNSFYFSLLGDAFYKRKFAFYFTKSYVSFIDQKLENALTPKNEKVTRQARRGDSEKYENLLSLTVQIFTVPNIVPALVSEGNLLGILIDKLLSVFKTYVFKKTAMTGSTAEEEPRYAYVLDSDSEVLKKRAYWHLVYDLRSVLQIRSVPKWLVYTAAATSPSSRLLEKLVEAWGLLAGMDRNKREARTHVEFESEQWLDAFTMEMQLTPIIYSLGQGLLDVGSNNGQEGGQSVADVHRVVSAFTTALEAWFAAEPSSSPKTRVWGTPDGRTEETQVLEYDIATQGVSLHLPLHRALGGVLAESCKEWGTSVLGLLPAEERRDRLLPFVSALLEGPLRAQVLAAQVRNNLWVRNGQAMAHKVSLLHENVQTFELFDFDVALMQSCATLCHSIASAGVPHYYDFFVTTIIHRFGLYDFFNWSSSGGQEGGDSIIDRLSHFFELKRGRAGSHTATGDDEAAADDEAQFEWMNKVPRQQKLALAEQCLRLLIIIANERSVVGSFPSSNDAFPRLRDHDALHRREGSVEERDITNMEYIKREIIHRLCISPATHSQVVKALPSRFTKAEGDEKSYLGAVDGILKEVAVFYRPEGKKQGMFRLKDDLWTTAFDPYFPHYSKQKVEKAYENYIEQFKNKNRGSSRAVPIACPRFRPISVAFESGVAEILASPFVFRIVFSVLYQVVQQKRQSTKPATSAASGNKYGQTSEVLFNESLHLLLLALQWRTTAGGGAHGRQRQGEEVVMGEASEHRRPTPRAVDMFDLQFSARPEDLALNLCRQFVIGGRPDAHKEEKQEETKEKGKEKEKEKGEEGMEVVVDKPAEPTVSDEPESILRFLVELAEEGEGLFDEQHDVLQAILALAEKCDDSGEATRLLHELRAKIEERKRRKKAAQEQGAAQKDREEGREGESLRERKMREAKERQKAIMAKFAAQQKKAMEHFEKESEKEGKETKDKGKEKDRGDAAAHADGDAAAEGGDVCVFCREGDSDENPLCVMAFIQRTNRLAHAERQSGRVWTRELRKRYFGATDEAEAAQSQSSGSKATKRKAKETDDVQASEDALEEVLESMDVEDEGVENMDEEEEEEEHAEAISLDDARRLAEAGEGDEDEGEEDDDEDAEDYDHDEDEGSEEDAEEIYFGELDRVDELIAEAGLEEDEDDDEDDYDEDDEGNDHEVIAQEQVQNAVMQLIDEYNRQRNHAGEETTVDGSGVGEAPAQQAEEEQPAAASASSSSSADTKPAKEKKKTEARKQFFAQWFRALQLSSAEGSASSLPSHAHSTSCGHYMHASCRHEYYVTQLKTMLTDPVFVLMSPLDVAKGEFACPLCRSVGNALVPLAAPPSSPAHCERVAVPERRLELFTDHRSFDAWVDKNVRQEATSPVEATAPRSEDSSSSAPTDRKAFRDTMADFVSRVYGVAMELSPENVALPAPYLTPFAYALFPSLIASAELMLRPSIPALTLSSTGGDQAFAPDYAVDRWEALRGVVDGTHRQKEADYMRTVMTSLFRLEELSSSSSSSAAAAGDALFALRKLIFGGIPPVQGQGDDAAVADPLRILGELKRGPGSADDGDDEEEDESRMQPFLSTDMFSLFVPVVLLEQRKRRQTGTEGGGGDELDNLLRLLLVGTVLQALVTIVQQITGDHRGTKNSDSAASSGKQDSPLETTLKGVIDAMKKAMIASALAPPLSPASTSGGGLSASFSPALSALGRLAEGVVFNGAQLAGEVKRLCLPFLYRAVLFQHFCLTRPLNLSGREVREEEEEFAALLAVLGLPSSLDDLLLSPPSGGGALSRLIAEWLDDFFSFHAARQKRDLADADADEAGSTVRFPLPAEPLLAPALPYELDRSALPNMYQNIQYFKSDEKQRCGVCGTSPRQPALCLLCGEFLCFASRCCAGEEGSGECNIHALRCGAGEGMFLLLKETAVVMLRYTITGCFYSSPYLDVHGEEDSGLRRGRPLYLDMDRYQALRDLWLGHQVPNVISKERSGQANTAFSLIQWHRM